MQLRAPLLACATTFGVTIAGSSQAAAGVNLAERPYGHRLGDGLSLVEGPLPVITKESCAGPATLPGIDVSYYQGNIDWGAVAGSGVKFAYVRVAHSLQFEDPKFQQNLAGARAAGIHTGVYQYFEPTEDAVAQAQLLIDRTGPLQTGDLPPMIDVESADTVGKEAYANAIRAWLDTVEAAYGVRGMIYSGFYYWNDYVGTDEFIDHPLMIPNYNEGCPLIPDYWPSWTIHQYCDCGSVPGVNGDVDVDTFNGDLAALLGYTVGAPVCGDGMCAPSEDPYACGVDCPPCGVIGGDGGTIDNGQACLELYGPQQFWRSEPVGQGGSLNWTNVTEYMDPSNYAVYRLYFAESGLYSLQLWVEKPFGETKQAKYIVSHAGGETVVPVDQSAQVTGWVSLGEFTFGAATDHYVRVNDNTGELNSLELSLVADALLITRLDKPDETTSTTSDESTGFDPGGEESDEGDASTGVSAPTTGIGPITSGGAGGSSGPGDPGMSEDEGGCGCNGAAGAPGLIVVVGLLRRRRR